MRAWWILSLVGCGDAMPTDRPTDDSSADSDVVETPTPSFTAVTWNVGGGLAGTVPSDPDGLSPSDADYSDDVLGNGLAWTPAVEAARAFLAARRPDVVAFQEIFDDRACETLDPAPPFPSVCDDTDVADPILTARLLGPDYQVACHPGKTDKCVGVRRAFGTMRGCTDRLCDASMVGALVSGCGSGARVASVVIDRVDGSALRLVNVHGSSGVSAEDQACRVRQFEAVFAGLDGQAALAQDDLPNLVMGDLNVDPARLENTPDGSRWNELTSGWTYLTEVGEDATPTYGGFASIDHVISDTFIGTCVHPGVSPDEAEVYDHAYFDHVPAVCTVR